MNRQAQQFGYDKIAAGGVTVIPQAATRDRSARSARSTLADGNSLTYDRLVLSPGIDLRCDAIPGYRRSRRLTRCRTPGRPASRSTLLRQPARSHGGRRHGRDRARRVNPARCPPAPYERASLIAHYLKTRKPRSKVIILDAKDDSPCRSCSRMHGRSSTPGMIEWVALSQGGGSLDLGGSRDQHARHRLRQVPGGSVANVIPPQKAGRIAELAGVADRTGWCPIDPVSFASKLAAECPRDRRRLPSPAQCRSRLRPRNAQGKICARGDRGHVGWPKARDRADAERRLLQPDRA